MKKIIKVYCLLLFTGWRSIEFFGTPKETMGTYIVCLKNNSIMEFNYSNFNGVVRWFKICLGDENIANPIMYWKPLPKKPPYILK